MFSKVVAPLYIPASSIWRFHFPHLLPTLVIVLFDSSPSTECEVIFCHGFIYFPFDWWCWTSFHELIGHLSIFIGEFSSDPLPIFFVFLLLNYSFLYILNILIYFRYNSLIRYVIYKFFLQWQGLKFFRLSLLMHGNSKFWWCPAYPFSRLLLVLLV